MSEEHVIFIVFEQKTELDLFLYKNARIIVVFCRNVGLTLSL